jgi:hypothetical protein
MDAPRPTLGIREYHDPIDRQRMVDRVLQRKRRVGPAAGTPDGILRVSDRAANPVFLELNRRSGPPSWNFNKYLVSADGRVVKRFDSEVRPDSAELQQAIERLLP